VSIEGVADLGNAGLVAERDGRSDAGGISGDDGAENSEDGEPGIESWSE
jgi:hypothetical protein